MKLANKQSYIHFYIHLIVTPTFAKQYVLAYIKYHNIYLTLIANANCTRATSANILSTYSLNNNQQGILVAIVPKFERYERYRYARIVIQIFGIP